MAPHLHVVPSPAPALTAERLLARIREKGGRPLAMRQERVFVLTDNEELATWLLERGAKGHSPAGYGGLFGQPDGAYHRARLSHGGKIEFDVWIDTIPVAGPSVWEALHADA